MAWSPLAGGRLATGDGVRPELLGRTRSGRLSAKAVDRSQMALAFVLAHPDSGRSAIVGSQNADRIRSATVRRSASTLDRNDVYAIVQASEGVPLP